MNSHWSISGHVGFLHNLHHSTHMVLHLCDPYCLMGTLCGTQYQGLRSLSGNEGLSSWHSNHTAMVLYLTGREVLSYVTDVWLSRHSHISQESCEGLVLFFIIISPGFSLM